MSVTAAACSLVGTCTGGGDPNNQCMTDAAARLGKKRATRGQPRAGEASSAHCCSPLPAQHAAPTHVTGQQQPEQALGDGLPALLGSR